MSAVGQDVVFPRDSYITDVEQQNSGNLGAYTLTRDCLLSDEQQDLARKSNEIWICTKRTFAEGVGFDYTFMCRPEFDFVTTTNEEEARARTAAFQQMGAKMFPAVVPSPATVERNFIPPFHSEINYAAVFEELGCKVIKNDKGVFATYPDKAVLDVRWEKYMKNHPELKLTPLDIFEIPGTATDDEFTKALVEHERVLSTGREFQHDWPVHLTSLIISKIELAQTDTATFEDIKRNLDHTYGLFSKIIDYFQTEESLEVFVMPKECSITRETLFDMLKTGLSMTMDLYISEPISRKSVEIFQINELESENPFKGMLDVLKVLKVLQDIKDTLSEDSWINYFIQRHGRTLDKEFFDIVNHAFYNYFLTNSKIYDKESFGNYDEFLYHSLSSPYNTEPQKSNLTDDEIQSEFDAGRRLFF